MKFKTVELNVEYLNSETGQFTYAVLFKGLATRKKLYLRRMSAAGDPRAEKVRYVVIPKNETQISDENEFISNPDEIREFIVSEDVGILDSRIEQLTENHRMISEINIALLLQQENMVDFLKKMVEAHKLN